jgi:hypothetical protein
MKVRRWVLPVAHETGMSPLMLDEIADGNSAKILVTKLAAAERQLNAAIRMTLFGEDELAIHTVAAAAYRIMRDIQEQRGRSPIGESLALGLFSVAHDLATRKIDALPEPFASDPQLSPLIKSLQTGIEAGEYKSWRDFHLNIYDEKSFWPGFNKPANFLKHADKDYGQFLDTSELKNDQILFMAINALSNLTNRSSPEMVAISMYLIGAHPEHSFLSEEVRQRLAALTPSQRRKFCRLWLADHDDASSLSREIFDEEQSA